MIDSFDDDWTEEDECRTCQSCIKYYPIPETHSNFGFCTEWCEYFNQHVQECEYYECGWNVYHHQINLTTE